MSRLVDRAAAVLERHTDRRGFLRRSAIAGSALVVAPRTFGLTRTSAYAAICSCSGSSCDCSATCCDGYTEFCCTLSGKNQCPPGSILAGWWKADAPGLCGPSAPRYYMDCNASCGGCSCGSSGVCASSCSAGTCSCGCAKGSCANRKSCCTRFRYGNCSNDVACVGPIICRVVTCTAPWEIEPTCEQTARTDNNTRYHDRPCLHTRDVPVIGDWDGDGVDGIGVRRGQEWHLRQTPSGGAGELSFVFGGPGGRPVTGDWNGDGVDGIGVVTDRLWQLRETPTAGVSHRRFVYGASGDIPIVGDWDGDGRDGIGVVRGRNWYLRNTASGGAAELTVVFGSPGDIPVVGDWDGDGRDGIGVRRGRTWYLAELPRFTGPGPYYPRVSRTVTFGRSDDLGIVGSWDGEADGIGVIRGNTWYLDLGLTGNTAEQQFVYGSSPLAAEP